MKFFTEIHLSMCNCHGWLPTLSRMVKQHPKDGHPPEGSVLHTSNLALTLYSQNYHQDAHKPSQLSGWPTIPSHHQQVYYRLGVCHLDLTHKTNRMLTHQPKVVTQNWALRLQSQNKLPQMVSYDPKNGHPIQNMVNSLPKGVHPFFKGWSQPSPGWSPTNSRMVYLTIMWLICFNILSNWMLNKSKL